MSIVDLTKDTFDETVNSDNTVVVDWWADWCGPCKAFAPVFADAAERNPDVVFAKVDTENNPELAASAGIMSIPTIMVFRENILVFSQSGALPLKALEDVISMVRELDMDEVRRELASVS